MQSMSSNQSARYSGPISSRQSLQSLHEPAPEKCCKHVTPRNTYKVAVATLVRLLSFLRHIPLTPPWPAGQVTRILCPRQCFPRLLQSTCGTGYHGRWSNRPHGSRISQAMQLHVRTAGLNLFRMPTSSPQDPPRPFETHS